MNTPIILWFRDDLRLDDNPALAAAIARGRPIIPVFIRETDDTPTLGGASSWWLHGALTALSGALERLGCRPTLRTGPATAVLTALAAETGADTVFWNRRYRPAAVARDRDTKSALKAAGLGVESFNGALLFEPWTIATKTGGPFRVFTPYWRACLQADPPPEPVPAPAALPAPDMWPEGEDLADWRLLPTKPDWAGGLREAWTPGEDAALARLSDFLDDRVAGYGTRRDIPGVDGTSRLSPHLRFGEISPRRIWYAARHLADREPGAAPGVESLLRELGWREFCHHLLHHFPTLPHAPFSERFGEFGWLDDPAGLDTWRRGLTGYPIVDAGMRQLWRTGWMHNRVRMIAASFLIKDLLIDWRIGQDWFWDTLVDADLANNAASWQWVAGCGADAAPFFRIFNPVLQGRKFDPDGAYVRAWVPELAGLSDKNLHAPWEASPVERAAAGVKLGTTYPMPIIDHAAARDRALNALKTLTH